MTGSVPPATEDSSSSLGLPEFQAVLMAAGRGSRFNEITRHKAKCLLPIGNLPMVWYPLNMLQRAGFQDVIVVAPESCRSEVSSLPRRLGLDLRLDVVCPPAAAGGGGGGGGGGGTGGGGGPDAHEDHGTADALRLVHDKLVSPRVLVVSCDLVSDVHLHHLTDLHRVRGAAFTALFAAGGGGGAAAQQAPLPGPKTKQKKERDFVGLDLDRGNQLVFLSSEADLDGDSLSLRRSALLEHPRVAVRSDLADAHLYVFEKWVCDYLQQNVDVSSVKGELLPLLVKSQFSRSSRRADPAADPDDSVGAREANPGDDERQQPASKKDVRPFLPLGSEAPHPLSSWIDHPGGDLAPSFHSRPLRCHAVLAQGGAALCARANNLPAYVDLNRQAARVIATVTGPEEEGAKVAFVHPTSQIQPKAQIGPECFVGAGTQVAGKTTTKHSTLGSNCKVEEKVRLSNSILMDDVTLREGCLVTGSLLCDGAVVPERCEIKDCIVGKGAAIKEGAKHSNEILMVVDEEDRMMEI